MNITKQNIDALNAVVKVDITADDYQEKVATVLNDYRKQANIPGFRKGNVPMGLIKKQYGKSVKVDEVNKLLQESLNKFLTEEKLDILGNPLPKAQDTFDWDATDFSFEFELGLTPEFDVDLKGNKDITKYDITVGEDLIDKEVENLQNRYGAVVSEEEVTEVSTIKGIFKNEEHAIESNATFKLADLQSADAFAGQKAGAEITVTSKGLFNEDYKLAGALGMKADEVKDLDVELTFTIEEVNKTIPADLDQELFDKIFGEGVVTTATELRDKIKEDAEKQFEQQADQQLLNAITESLIENTKFDLPKDFLVKWLSTAGEKQLTSEEAEAEFDKSEKGLRYQLIESKVMSQNDIKVDYAELKDYAAEFIKQQMAQFGQTNPEEKEVNDIAARVLSNQEEAQRLQTQLISNKLLTFYKENITFNAKEVSYEDFIKEVYS